MYENFNKDGIYEIKLTNRNPYCRYLVVKTYGNEQRQKRMCSLEDCKQQIQEWDEEYSRKDPFFINRGFKNLLKKKKENKPYRNYYSVFDRNGNLYMEGFGQEIAERFGVKSKAVCNAANEEGRCLSVVIDGEKKLYDVVKTGQPGSDWSIAGEINW